MSDKVKLRYYDMANPNEKIDLFCLYDMSAKPKKVKNAIEKMDTSILSDMSDNRTV